ncbi:MAG: hypothetical protein GXO85_05310 [Chlorobi bacterium]|nr:hypothetical protein [Chlorobiota bacterium]
MIKEKYKQLCLARQFGVINTIEFTQPLYAIQKIFFFWIKEILIGF